MSTQHNFKNTFARGCGGPIAQFRIYVNDIARIPRMASGKPSQYTPTFYTTRQGSSNRNAFLSISGGKLNSPVLSTISHQMGHGQNDLAIIIPCVHQYSNHMPWIAERDQPLPNQHMGITSSHRAVQIKDKIAVPSDPIIAGKTKNRPRFSVYAGWI